MNISQLFNRFVSGEISPLYMGRTESAVYNNGSKRIEGFIPLLTGGLMKIPGSWYDGMALGVCKLIPFQLSTGYVIIELSNLKARFWTSTYTLFGTPLEITTPYGTADLSNVRYAVSQNEIYLVHPSYAPRKITWNGSTFSLSTPIFTGTYTFNLANNYPSSVFFHAGRLGLGGTNAKPNAIWLSSAPDSATGTFKYTDFTMGPLAGNAILLQENDMYGSTIKWVANNKVVVAGTDKSIWADNGDVPTPATFDMNIVNNSGACSIQAEGTKDILVYIGRDGKSLRALVWQSGSNASGYAPINISQNADHILVGGVVDLSIMDFPLPIVWIVRADGVLVSCTLDLNAGVIAFARHNLGGLVESIAVAPGDNSDILFLSVNRDGTRCIEHIPFTDIIDANIEEAHYVNSGIRYSGSLTSTITGLNHLSGKTVTGIADGNILPALTVQGDGSVALPYEAQLIHIGLPYDSYLEPIAPELPANGTSMSKKRQIEKAWIRLYNSYGGSMGTSESKLQPFLYNRYGVSLYGDKVNLYTGDMDLTVSGNIDTQGEFVVKHSEPVPFTVLALILRVKVLEV